MKAKITILFVLLLIMLTIPPQAFAFSIPSGSFGYTLKATSPSDNPGTDTIEATPGDDVTVDATATIRYEGESMTTPPITVVTELRLCQGSVEKASSTETHHIDPIALENGKTYTRTGSGKITVPAGTAPGTYTLKAKATASAGFLGLNYEKSMTKEYTVKVLAPAAATQDTQRIATATVVPTVTATPTASNTATTTPQPSANGLRSAGLTATPSQEAPDSAITSSNPSVPFVEKVILAISGLLTGA